MKEFKVNKNLISIILLIVGLLSMSSVCFGVSWQFGIFVFGLELYIIGMTLKDK